MEVIIPDAISVISARAFFIFKSLIPDLSASILALAVPTATSRALLEGPPILRTSVETHVAFYCLHQNLSYRRPNSPPMYKLNGAA